MIQVAGRRIPKWLVALVAVLFVGVISGTVSRCTTGAIERERASNAASQTSQPKSVAQTLPAFKVERVEDVSVGATPRFDYRVVVSGKPTPAQLTQIAEAVFGQAKAKQPFAALRIGFYDYPEYATREFTLGQVEYAPDGDWAKASTIEPGDYDAMKPVTDLPTKDWSKQLTPGEVKVWAAWWTEYDKRAEAIGGAANAVDEVGLTADIAKATGTASAEVKAVLFKQSAWTNQ